MSRPKSIDSKILKGYRLPVSVVNNIDNFVLKTGIKETDVVTRLLRLGIEQAEKEGLYRYELMYDI
jgi:hypothetical protein